MHGTGKRIGGIENIINFEMSNSSILTLRFEWHKN